MTKTRSASRGRFNLLATSAGILFATSGGAFAQDAVSSDNFAPELTAQAGHAFAPELDSQVVIANPGTPTTARDPVNVTGVGQMIIDEQNGFIGLCTGTLINPRTVVFAAHCVNERAANAYGENSDGQPIGFGFGSNNNVAGASAFGQWLGGYNTNTARFMYDVNYVSYNSLSLEPAAASFLYGDVAVASLDTPAEDVPTWAVLFSALTPTTITAAGTGYHVGLSGYGNNGTGTTGSTGGIDFRRRIAENMIGGLASLDNFENFLFGGASTDYPQNLYWIDFDDPNRGTATPPSVFDFNAWRDNATANEGITASGDSGGPLILDQEFDIDVVIGVLSGGYTRFFSGQPPNGYGTASFYQPLYLYWDWIAENNPYHYVSAVAGNGDWSDATHWVTTLDPNYMIIDGDGHLVNGVPDDPGGTTIDNSGQFGQACFQSGGTSDCLDMETGVETIEAKPIGTGAAGSLSGSATNDAAVVSAALLNNGPDAQDASPAALPVATIDNGLPGASDFVPNNDDGDRLTSTKPAYYDVTLSAAGETTLDIDATVDRFAITAHGATLDVTSGHALTSLMALNHWDGIINVDGELNVHGDYMLFVGLLTGSGEINAPFLTSTLGTIAPGGMGTDGTLTIRGNMVLASGNTLLIDLGPAGHSDLLAVEELVGGDGFADVGGALGFAAAAGHTVHAGDIYTILTAEGGVTGTFADPGAISAILDPELHYSAHAITVEFTANDYADLGSLDDNPIRESFAALLDQNRPNQDDFPDIYGPLDLASEATIAAQLDALAPAGETTAQMLGVAATDTMADFFRSRLGELDGSAMDGSVALLASPQQLAQFGAAGMGISQRMQMLADGGGSGQVIPGGLPDHMRGYIAAGYMEGDSEPMSTTPTGDDGRDELDGWFAAAGVESRVSANSAIGVAVSYSSFDGESTFNGSNAHGQLFQLTGYGNTQFANGFVLDGMLSMGTFANRVERDVVFMMTPYHLVARDDAFSASGEVGLSKDLAMSGVMTLTPRLAVRRSHIGFSPTSESGGGPAMTYDREDVNSTQGRLGATLAGNYASLRPYITGTIVHDFEDRPGSFGANFVGGVGPSAVFALNGQDTDWGEVDVGVTFGNENVDLSLALGADVGRDDVDVAAARGSASFRLHF